MGLNCLKATATSRRQFTFHHSVPRTFWYSFYRPRTDERLSQPWSHPVVFEHGTPGLVIQHFCIILFSNLDRYFAAPFWNYISFVITYICQNLWTYIWGCFDLRCPGTSSGIPLQFHRYHWNSESFFAMSFFFLFFNKIIKSLILSGDDFVKGLIFRDTFHVVSMVFSKFFVTRRAKAWPPSWIDSFLHSVACAQMYKKSRFLKTYQDFLNEIKIFRIPDF